MLDELTLPQYRSVHKLRTQALLQIGAAAIEAIDDTAGTLKVAGFAAFKPPPGYWRHNPVAGGFYVVADGQESYLSAGQVAANYAPVVAKA